MKSTTQTTGVDYEEIAELNRWLEQLLRHDQPADPLTLCNIHRRLANHHSQAAEAALTQISGEDEVQQKSGVDT